MRAIPQAAIDFIKAHEGCVLRAYQDSVGVWTAGYGHTEGVLEGKTYSQDQATDWLANDDLPLARTRLYNAVNSDAVMDELTDNQYAALLSFVFNLGANPGWTIWKRLRAKQFDQVPLEMMKFVNAGGKKLDGLVRRRADEVVLWGQDEPGSASEDPPSSVTRQTATPPTPSDPVPASKTGHIIAAGATVAASVPAGVDKVVHTIAPYADKSDFLQHIVSVLVIVAAIAAVATLAFAWLHKRKAQH